MSKFNSAGNSFNSNDHFSSNPLNVSLPRSTFDRSKSTKTTLKVGKLIPFYLDEVLPGDTFNIDMNFVARGVTPLYPTMDNAVIDTYFFFVPNRLVWKDWEKFNGFNENPWYQNQELLIPSLNDVTIKVTSASIGKDRLSYSKPQDLACYLGIPSIQFSANMDGTARKLLPDINLLPFRSYAKIWNDWFRDQNTQGTILYSTGGFDTTHPIQLTQSDPDTSIQRVWQAAFVDNQNIDRISDSNTRKYDFFYETIQYGVGLAPVNKLMDYFTSCLPSPQKGDPVTLPIGISGIANLKLRNVPDAGNSPLSREKLSGVFNLFDINGAPIGKSTPGSSSTPTNQFFGISSNQNAHSGQSYLASTFSFVPPGAIQGTWNNNVNLSGYINGSDLSGVSVNINELRQAIALQQALEKDARGGTRYIEVIRSHFGVISPDARLQRSEYLGGSRTFIRNNQVLQTSSTSGQSPLGQTGAYSLTNDRASFVKSFTEHGYILGLTCVRVEQSYSQGIRRLFSRKRRFDFYWPVFDNIGEQPVYSKEIYVNTVADTLPTANNVFGYQEAWADYRYGKNTLTGYMRPIIYNYGSVGSSKYSGSLYSWTYTTTFNNAPTLSNQFQQENRDQFTQTLAFTGNQLYDFWIDFFISNKCTRVMNTYSIPGLDRM